MCKRLTEWLRHAEGLGFYDHSGRPNPGNDLSLRSKASTSSDYFHG
jgi:hypothetical protein